MTVPEGITAFLGMTTMPSRTKKLGPSKFSGFPAGLMTTLSPMRAFLSMMAFSM